MSLAPYLRRQRKVLNKRRAGPDGLAPQSYGIDEHLRPWTAPAEFLGAGRSP